MTKHIVSLAIFAMLSGRAQAQDIEKRLAEIDSRVYPVGSEDAKNAPKLFGKFLKAERDRVNRDDVAMWKDLAAKNDKGAWEKFVAPRIASLKQSLGTFPALSMKDVPVHIGKTLLGNGFEIDNLVYESRPGLWVTANLYRPVPVPKSAPGIVIISSHHNPKTQGELQDMGMTWARAGCYVLVPDQVGHGERRQHPFVDKTSYPVEYKIGRQDYFFRYNLGVQLHLVGESLIGWMANDMIAGVTLLLKKQNTDPARIILLGSVAGGGDPSGVTAALDERIQCLVPFNFGGPQPETKYPLPADAETSFNYFGGGSWESTRNIADSGPGGFLPWVIVSSIAPRHLIHAHEFAWDGERDPVWKRYKKIWSWYGADDKLGVAHGKGGLSGKPPEATHCNNIGPEHRTMMHPLFKKWFGIDASEYKNRVDGAELVCWTPELKARLKPRLVHELAAELWEQRRPKAVANPDELVKQTRDPGRKAFWEKGSAIVKQDLKDDRGAVAARRVVLADKKTGLEATLLLLTPTKAAGNERIVLGISQQGKQAFLKEDRAEIAGLLRSGIAVCLVDLPGAGETVNGGARGRTSGATSASATLRMLGGTMPFLQANALSDVMSFLKNDAQTRKQVLHVCVWAESFAKVNSPSTVMEVPYDVDKTPSVGEPMALSLAYFYRLSHRGGDDGDLRFRGFLSRGGLVNFQSALRSPFLYVPHDTLDVPLLRQVEAEDMAIAAYGEAKAKQYKLNPIRLEGMIDGLNRAASQAEIDRSFAQFRKLYGESPITLSAERSGPEETVRWLVKCFD